MIDYLKINNSWASCKNYVLSSIVGIPLYIEKANTLDDVIRGRASLPRYIILILLDSPYRYPGEELRLTATLYSQYVYVRPKAPD